MRQRRQAQKQVIRTTLWKETKLGKTRMLTGWRNPAWLQCYSKQYNSMRLWHISHLHPKDTYLLHVSLPHSGWGTVAWDRNSGDIPGEDFRHSPGILRQQHGLEHIVSKGVDSARVHLGQATTRTRLSLQDWSVLFLAIQTIVTGSVWRVIPYRVHNIRGQIDNRDTNNSAPPTWQPWLTKEPWREALWRGEDHLLWGELQTVAEDQQRVTGKLTTQEKSGTSWSWHLILSPTWCHFSWSCSNSNIFCRQGQVFVTYNHLWTYCFVKLQWCLEEDLDSPWYGHGWAFQDHDGEQAVHEGWWLPAH